MKRFKVKYVQGGNINICFVEAYNLNQAKLVFYLSHRGVDDILNIVEGDKDV